MYNVGLSYLIKKLTGDVGQNKEKNILNIVLQNWEY